MLNMKLSCHVNCVLKSVITLGGSLVSSTTGRIKHKKEIPSVWHRMTRQDFIIRWLMVCTALLNDKNCWVTAAD